MAHSLSRLIRAAALTVAAAAAAAGSAAAAAAEYYPKEAIPGVRANVIDCDVSADQTTAHCGYRPSIYWRPSARDLAVIKDIDAHPARLADATPGARVDVIVRRDPGKRTDGTNPAEPLDWTPPPPPGAAVLVLDPTWSLLPPADLIKEFYPERAMRMGINGDAKATCTIGLAGDLVGCWLSNETPTDQGFGVALLKITTCARIDPLTKNGTPTPGRTIKVGAHFTVAKTGAFAVQLVLLTD